MRESTRGDWERFWGERGLGERYPSVGDVVGELVAALGKAENKSILEIGAGSGRDSARLAQLGAEVFVLDYARAPLELVKGLAVDQGLRIPLVQADARLTPFRDRSFDCLFHQGLLEHFRDSHPLLEENWRLLKDGGVLLVDVPQKYHSYTLLKHTLILFNLWFAGWETEFSPSRLENLLIEEGFEVIHTYGNWMSPPLIYRILREITLRAPLPSLPLYPKGYAGVERLVRAILKRLRTKRIFLYTCIVIGAVGKKRA